MDKAYLGVDVGNKGFLALQYKGEFTYYSIEGRDLHELGEIITGIRNQYKYITCLVEDVHAIYGSSAMATFSFGFNKGVIIGLLIANNIPYQLVQPKEWQKEIWSNSDMEILYRAVKIKDKLVMKRAVDTKKTSINAAKRMFPNEDFRRTEKCKKIDDNKVDATLISEYGRRKNL